MNDVSPLAGRELLVGVAGGIAAFKSAALVSYLVQHSAHVTVIMTETASQFVGPATFAALTGRPVQSSMFSDQYPLGPHIELSRQADLMCIAPATANLIAKIANGIADDLLTTTYLCMTKPVVIAPAMNCEMWAHPSVVRNVETIRSDGVACVDPGEGWLSCRQKGAGRMAEPTQIVESIIKQLSTLPHS